MRPAHIGRLLLTLGVLVGVAASIGLLLRLAHRTEPGAAAADDAKLRDRACDSRLVDEERSGPRAIGRRARNPDIAVVQLEPGRDTPNAG